MLLIRVSELVIFAFGKTALKTKEHFVVGEWENIIQHQL